MTDDTRTIVHARYIKNRTPTGRVTVRQMSRAVHYIGYGHKFENPKEYLRGQWYSPEREQTHEDVVHWAEDKAQDHRYTYTLVLSVRDGIMHDDDFTETMREAQTKESIETFPTDWRLMVHRDSDHDHAHVVFFRERTVRKAELAQWREALQSTLNRYQEQRLEEQQAQGIVRERALYGGAFLG
jgi:hypothetical protein